jgi:hypothetical protein
MMISWWLKHFGVILSVLMCDIWINVLLQTSALVGPLHIEVYRTSENRYGWMLTQFGRIDLSSRIDWHSWKCCYPWKTEPNTDELRHGHLMSSLFSSSYDVHTDRPPCKRSVTTSCNTARLHKQGSSYLHHRWSLNYGHYSQANFIHI